MKLPALSVVLASMLMAACAHGGARCEASKVTAATPERAAREPAAPLMDLTWWLQQGESEVAASVPDTLHAFTAGRWECALGPVGADDALHEGALRLQRSRRLACTHDSGATVQSELACAYTRSAEGLPSVEAPRGLTLGLDSLPLLRVTCAASPVEQLSLRAAQGRELLCAHSGGAIAPCAAAPIAPSAQ